MSILAERLRKLRSKRSLTQSRLAELIKVSPRVYNRWENGIATPHFDAIVAIANTLQVSLDELAGRKPITSEPLIRNHKLHEIYQQVNHLSDEDQKVVIVLLDSLIKRSKFNKILKE